MIAKQTVPGKLYDFGDGIPLIRLNSPEGSYMTTTQEPAIFFANPANWDFVVALYDQKCVLVEGAPR